MLLQRRKRDWGRWAHDTTVRILEAVWPLWSRYRFAGPPHSRLVVACAAAALPPRKACSPLGAWLSPPPRRQVGQVGQDHRSHARTPSAFYGVSPPSRPPPRPVCSEGAGGVKIVGGCLCCFSCCSDLESVLFWARVACVPGSLSSAPSTAVSSSVSSSVFSSVFGFERSWESRLVFYAECPPLIRWCLGWSPQPSSL